LVFDHERYGQALEVLTSSRIGLRKLDRLRLDVETKCGNVDIDGRPWAAAPVGGAFSGPDCFR